MEILEKITLLGVVHNICLIIRDYLVAVVGCPVDGSCKWWSSRVKKYRYQRNIEFVWVVQAVVYQFSVSGVALEKE